MALIDVANATKSVVTKEVYKVFEFLTETEDGRKILVEHPVHGVLSEARKTGANHWFDLKILSEAFELFL